MDGCLVADAEEITFTTALQTHFAILPLGEYPGHSKSVRVLGLGGKHTLDYAAVRAAMPFAVGSVSNSALPALAAQPRVRVPRLVGRHTLDYAAIVTVLTVSRAHLGALS